MQKGNSVIKNYILSSEPYLLKDSCNQKQKESFSIKKKNVKINR